MCVHSALHSKHLPLPSSADGRGWEDRMKDGKKKQFDERRHKTAGTREGKEEQKTNEAGLIWQTLDKDSRFQVI